MAQTKIIYGFHSVIAALNHHPENILNLYMQDKDIPNERVVEVKTLALDNNLVLQNISSVKLDKLAGQSYHQGVAAEIRVRAPADEKTLLAWIDGNIQHKPLLLILEGIEDPHNLGACLRSAAAFGVDWVVMGQAKSAPLNATVSKVACGADQMLPIAQVGNLARCLEQLKERGVWVIGTAGLNGTPLYQIDLKRSVALIMGAEGKGMRDLTLKKCDAVATIPLHSQMESVNVSVATGICLYECARQRV